MISVLTELCNVSSEKSCSGQQNGLGRAHCLAGPPAPLSKQNYTFRPDESSISSLSHHMRTQGSDPTHSPGHFMSQWFRSWGSRWKSKVLRIIILIWHVPILFYGLCFQCNRIAAKCASSVLMKPLADHLGHTAEQGDAQIVRAGHLGEMLEEAIKGTWLPVDPRPVLGTQRCLASSPGLGMCTLPTVPTVGPFSRPHFGGAQCC